MRKNGTFGALVGVILTCLLHANNCAFSAESQQLVIDAHMHLLGLGSDNSGCYLNGNQQDWLHPIDFLKTKYMISAVGIEDPAHADREYVATLQRHLDLLPPHLKYLGLVYAFAPTYDRKTKEVDWTRTGLAVPNDYALKLAKKHPHLIPVGSVHPYQRNVTQEIARLHAAGVRLLKILPNSMHFDPSDKETAKFFAAVAAYKIVLIAHVGDEHSVSGGGINNEYGNPLLYETWLMKFPSLKIIFAHVGSEGTSRTPDGKVAHNFDLVLDLMRRYPRQTYADLSSFSSAFIRIKHLSALLAASELHGRLLFGSDYPLPKFTPLVWLTLATLHLKGFLDAASVVELLGVQQRNPLTYNYEVLRRVRFEGRGFPEEIFAKNFLNIFTDRKPPAQLLKALKKR